MTQLADTDFSDLHTLQVSDADLVARATALIPLIREHAADATKNRKVSPEVIDAIAAAGLFHVMVPERLGGHGSSFKTACDVVAELARGDGSTGWVTALTLIATAYASTFTEQTQQDIFGPNPGARICGIFSPGDKSEKVEGGYLVSGRWPYASGSFAAQWASITITLEGGVPGMALIPAEAFTIEPSWFVAGMQGTGSDTIVVKDHFLPEYRVQAVPDMFASKFRSPFTEDTIASMPFNAVAAGILVAPQIGLGRHALELTREKLPKKPVAYTAYAQAKDSPTHQLNVARAATKLHLAELLIDSIAAEIDGAAEKGVLPDPEALARVRNDTGVVAELINEEIDYLLTANGAGSFADANVLGRIWRDSETAARHALVTPEIGREAYGRQLLENNDRTIGL
ncbi:acyl-CoA dehydrogenase family protein [Rhodococcus sp. BP-149]|uniref:acyl-CoA dehydrogenase family protein n=1 Tax=unclassified Rhodococcus (in: high G+C Gram-positive bacteria) TaxID=192944 RepID=UPI001C9B81CD|nr:MULTISPECIES: acyl-CoA dehydrogenase family protein [unclassified Rhodococcus (in: high G+C Gram-positive bacteria)]MBY6685616.1 acyl-CoA dehydrogenase family protein [Rhodococcus sp. BP-288]MBY6694836.1 acyl-CoA dehydrogenase family protein [Rhodococcus sp. BP-188]MBY6696682.1 acyl-CoA dehydrogenase family protein [Rhodococcus sp. BP-285]MBY6703338.1 acyl-CoA dehydrogenase family protein [Rhodococcus sp. BP-283]MBY6710708.1 acyl-CoA dehydrogenase family protein [Rhodococcus sp. BP-160]